MHVPLGELVDRLSTVTQRIFHLEKEIRDGVDLPDEEIGRRARLIRDLNAERVALKNAITAFSGEGFLDVKVAHRSEIK